MLQSPEACFSRLKRGTAAKRCVPPPPSCRRSRTAQRRWPHNGVLVLRVMATRHYWLAVAVCESKVVSQPPQVSPRRYPTLRSLRLRHPTRCLAGSVAAPPIRPLRQLVNVPGPARRDSLGTADAAPAASPAPSGHPFHARGSLLSGARKAYRTSDPMSRVGTRYRCALHSLGRDASRNCLRSPARRSTPHPSTSGTPSVYYVITTMSSRA
jgi:hypothetical protein